MKRNDEPYCLVLSGGGAKGIYHIGVWKALRELDINVNAFIGNSIGAIIAAFLAQGNEEKLYFIGDNITVDYLLKIPDDLIENGELKVSFKHLSAFRRFYKDALMGGGLDTSPLKKILLESLSEELIRKSGNDLGVVTFNISDMKSNEIFIEEMEEGTVIDYLMASSAFPGFNHAVIKGKKFIDGGVYENIPYRQAKKRGYKKIITIDISGMGINKRPNIEGTETVYIKNSINMGGVLDFNREFLNNFMNLGYLDTLRVFGALKGIHYFIEPDIKWERHFDKLLKDPKMVSVLIPILNIPKSNQTSVELNIRKILPNSLRHNHKDLFYILLEMCAVILRLDKIQKYKIEELISLIKSKQNEEDEKLVYLDNVTSNNEVRRLLKKIKLVLKKTTVRESLIETPYHNSKLTDKVLAGKTGLFLKKGLNTVYPELRGGLFFLELINNLLIFKI